MDEQNEISKKDEQLLRIAALACLEREEEEDQSFASSPDYVPVDPAWVAGMTRRLSHKAGKKKKHIRLRRVVALAAIMVLVLGAATVSADPKGFAELFADDHRQYSAFTENKGVVLEKPQKWESELYPTWAPEGFSVGSVLWEKDVGRLTLTNDNTNKTIVYTIYKDDPFNSANTEELYPVEITVFGQICVAYLDGEGERATFSIKKDNETISIDGAITLQELEHFVENIKNLK